MRRKTSGGSRYPTTAVQVNAKLRFPEIPSYYEQGEEVFLRSNFRLPEGEEAEKRTWKNPTMSGKHTQTHTRTHTET